MDETLKALLEQAKKIKMTPRQLDEQRLSFAYGNLACTTNHKPARAAFKKIAVKDMGWTEAEFDIWAATREWER